MATRFLIFFLIIFAIEVYFLQAVRTFVQDFSPGRRAGIIYTAYGMVIVNLSLGVVAMFYPPPNWLPFFRFLTGFFLILAVCKLLGISFLIIDDIIRFFRWVFSFIVKSSDPVIAGHSIPRLKFLSQIAVAITVIPGIGFLYGMVRGAYKFRVHNVKVPSGDLPHEFDGFRIVQLSDIHTGSFMNTDALEKAFDIAMQQGADMIVFTGDLVNNEHRETEGFLDIFRKLKAPYGVYSILGNHDYGDYIEWPSESAKRENFEGIKRAHAEAGWRLLLNEHVAIEKDGARIGLLGIENWGANMHFTKYGRMADAHAGSDIYPFRILMSHDPSHWEKEVSVKYTDVHLTLSGHTHGMQLGIEIPGLKWSPAKFMYPFWAGLYRKENQFLYVNRGLGFLGYPGRLGIWPEITVIELKRA